jgi:hypothetical protein
MRTEAICHPVSCLVLSFITIKALPQIRQSRMNKPQFIIVFLDIQVANVRRFTFGN